LRLQVWLKFENLQFTAAYKERGALNALLHLTQEQRERGVIAASAGNHAQGLSYHGSRLGVPVTIVMPKTTPTVKVMQTEMGGKVVLEGETFDEAYAYARSMEKQLGLTFVHPSTTRWWPLGRDGRARNAGGSSRSRHAGDPGGRGRSVDRHGHGGARHQARHRPDRGRGGIVPDVQPAQGHQLSHRRRHAGRGIAVKEPGEFTSKMLANLLDDFVLVSESELEHALCLLLNIEKTVVEGAGAAGLAALLAHRHLFKGKKVGIVLSGGNIDQRLLANVLLRDLARSGRLARLKLTLQDRPGALFKVMEEFNRHQVNIIEIYHQRIFTHLPAKGLTADIECEARTANRSTLWLTPCAPRVTRLCRPK
jgi:threonine dehydratase